MNPIAEVSLFSKIETWECYVPVSLYFIEIISVFFTKIFLSHNADWRKVNTHTYIYTIYICIYTHNTYIHIYIERELLK